MRRIPHQFVWRYVMNVLRVHLWPRPGNPKLVPPLMPSVYLTRHCNFRCTYCNDGHGIKYPDMPEQNRLQLDQLKQVLRILRKAAPAVNFTGGEPTMRRDLPEILRHASDLGFCPIVLNTNGYLLDQYVDSLRHLDVLVVSLDAMNDERGNALIGIGKPVNDKVKRNILLAAEMKKARKLSYEIVVNSVIMPDTIPDARAVFTWAQEQGFYWTPMPHVIDYKPNPALVGNPEYTRLIDDVIQAKRNGARVYSNMEALRIIRDFQRFECYPTCRPVINPDGFLPYPCSLINEASASILEHGSYEKTISALEGSGALPYCDSRCHVGCYTEPSTALTFPLAGLTEFIRWVCA